MKKETSIAKVDLSIYPVLNPEQSLEAMEIVQENLGSDGVEIGNLTKITVPSQGGTMFTVDTGEGEEAVKTITGIIVFAPKQNGYWNTSIEEAPNSPPACFSADGITGIGDRFGEDLIKESDCSVCPLKQWGTDPKGGGGKACRDMRPMFLLQSGEFLPIVLQTNRMSIKRLSAYFTQLARKGIPYYSAITEIGLLKEQKAGKVPYSVFTFKLIDVIPKEQRPLLKSYQDTLKKLAVNPPTMSDFSETQDNIIFDSDENAPLDDNSEGN